MKLRDIKEGWRFFLWCIVWRLPLAGMPSSEAQWQKMKKLRRKRPPNVPWWSGEP